MKKLFFLFLLIGFTISLAQVENSKRMYGSTYLPNFYIDYANYPSDQAGKTRIDVFIQMPYGSIQFIKTKNVYNAKYIVSLTFYDEEKENVIFEKLWTEKISSEEFTQTYSKQNYNISYRSFDLQPRKYTVVCFIEDVNSQNTITLENKLELKEYTSPTEISDLVFIRERIQSQEGERVVPNVSNIVNSDVNSLSMFYEIVTDKERPVKIKYTINDKNRDKAYTQVQDAVLKPGKNFVDHTITEIPLQLGQFILYVEVLTEEENLLTGIGKPFRSIITGFPISIIDLDEAIEQMEYIADGDIIDSLEDIESFDEKLNLFVEFWKRKDPSPSTEENEILEEYYRRVDYSNRSFKGYYAGWKTDMGMVYIMLGPPDQVQREPMALNSKPYQLWEYFNLNRTFYFYDQTGFGDYRLVNRDYGDWFRYRQ